MLEAMFHFRKEQWYMEMNLFEKIIMWLLCPIVGFIAYMAGFIENIFTKIISKIRGL